MIRWDYWVYLGKKKKPNDRVDHSGADHSGARHY